MRNVLVLFALVLCMLAGTAHADTTTAPVAAQATTTISTANGWAPSVIGDVGAFYFNGNYQLLSGGVNAGAAYTWQQQGNVNSAGIYLGPQVSKVNGTDTTGLTILAYVDLFKTSVGQFGLGLGTQFWASGKGMTAPTKDNTFLAMAYKF